MEVKSFELDYMSKHAVLYVREPIFDGKPTNVLVDACSLNLGAMFPDQAEILGNILLAAAKQARVYQKEHDKKLSRD